MYVDAPIDKNIICIGRQQIIISLKYLLVIFVKYYQYLNKIYFAR